MEKSYKTTDTRWVCMLDFMIILTQIYYLTQVSSTFTTILAIINISLWLIILTINLLPKEYVKEKVELSADKTALKKDIKNGKEINGAKIVTNLNMQVK